MKTQNIFLLRVNKFIHRETGRIFWPKSKFQVQGLECPRQPLEKEEREGISCHRSLALLYVGRNTFNVHSTNFNKRGRGFAMVCP
jgi:hypothetical protein